MKWIASVALLCCLLFAVPWAVSAQELEPHTMSPVAQINPLGFLQFGPNIEVAFPVSPMVSITPGVRITTLGVLPHLLVDEGESLGLSWTLSVTSHIFPEARGMQGLYVGPRLEAGRAASSDSFASYDTNVLVAASDFGYRWVYPSGFHLMFGVQAGAFLTSWEGTDGSSGEEVFGFGMLVLGLGIAF